MGWFIYLLYEQEMKCSAPYTLHRNKTELKICPNADKFKIELRADMYSWANELMILTGWARTGLLNITFPKCVWFYSIARQ